MKIKTILLCISAAVAITAVFQVNNISKENKKLKTENTRLANNQERLLSETNFYKVADSLNAAQIYSLELTLKEYKKYRAEDAKLISQLKAKEAHAIVGTNTQTNIAISAPVYDSIRVDTVYRETKNVQHFNYSSKWLDVEGDITNDTIELRAVSRDALKIVESVEYKRFLGFLWKTSKIKRRQVDVVSKNPNTDIISVDYICIEP